MNHEEIKDNPKVKSQDDMTRDIYMMLGDMNGKLTLALERHDRLEIQQNQLRKRISALERSRSWFLGAIAVIVFAVQWLKDHVRDFIG